VEMKIDLEGAYVLITGTNSRYLVFFLRWAEPVYPAIHLDRPSVLIPAAFRICRANPATARFNPGHKGLNPAAVPQFEFFSP
jgi:hypothetical protein